MPPDGNNLDVETFGIKKTSETVGAERVPQTVEGIMKMGTLPEMT